MKNQLVRFSLLLFISFCLTSCGSMYQSITGEGPVIDYEVELKHFNRIRVETDWAVELIPGPLPAIIIQTEENLIPYIQYTIRGNELHIKTNKNLHSKSKNIKVFFNVLDEIQVENQAIVYSNAIFEQKNFHAVVKNEAELSLRLWTENLQVSASNKSRIVLKGISHQLDALSEVSSRIEAQELKANKVYARASMDGFMKVFASDYIRIETETGGVVEYIGNPAKVEEIVHEKPRRDTPPSRRDRKTDDKTQKEQPQKIEVKKNDIPNPRSTR